MCATSLPSPANASPMNMDISRAPRFPSNPIRAATLAAGREHTIPVPRGNVCRPGSEHDAT
jgi:hypothetical protein